MCIDYPQKLRKGIDIKEMMPIAWELPRESFFAKVNLPQSSNPTVNFLDALVRKNDLIHTEFRGTNQPKYMKKDKVPNLVS